MGNLLKTYTMVFCDQYSCFDGWFYFKEEFSDSLFPDGYCSYDITVDKNDIILLDDYNYLNSGKPFISVYNITDWDIKYKSCSCCGQICFNDVYPEIVFTDECHIICEDCSINYEDDNGVIKLRDI